MTQSQSRVLSALLLCLAACSSPPPVTVRRTRDSSTAATSGDARPNARTLPDSVRRTFASTMTPIDCAPPSGVTALSDTNGPMTHFASGGVPGPIGHPKVGDTVLVDVTSYNDAQVLIERVHSFGVLQSRTGDHWRVRDARTKRDVDVELRETDWLPAHSDKYSRRTTGEKVGTPAYYVHIERYASLPASGCIVGQAVPTDSQ